MTKERLEEIKDSIELQKKLREVVGINYDEILVEEIDLYNEVIELQERIGEVNKYLCQLLQEAYLEESSNVDIGLIEYAVDLLKGENCRPNIRNEYSNFKSRGRKS